MGRGRPLDANCEHSLRRAGGVAGLVRPLLGAAECAPCPPLDERCCLGKRKGRGRQGGGGKARERESERDKEGEKVRVRERRRGRAQARVRASERV
jgi:hypothetical protein